MEDYRNDLPDADRRDALRLTTVLPTLSLDGRLRALQDFSETGFRAVLPETYRKVGATGEAVLHMQAAGYRFRKRILFEVRHLDGDSVGVFYEILETVNESSTALF
jgi:hypothetical protein